MDTTPEQLDLFEENGDIALLRRQLVALRRQYCHGQRTTALRYRQLSKLCLHLQEENSQLKQRLHLLEKALPCNKDEVVKDEDDYLLKLFAAAYLPPP